jgi:hypothetical protein
LAVQSEQPTAFKDEAMTKIMLGSLVAVAAIFGGCSSNFGYVSIPAERGSVAASNPNTQNVRSVVVTAVEAGLTRFPVGGPYELVLPPQTTAETYAVVTHRLGGDAVVPSNIPAVPLDEDGKPLKQEGDPPPVVEPTTLGEFPAVTVEAVRIRGQDAEVDLVRPESAGRRLLTVSLEWEPGFGWSADPDDVRAWRVDPTTQPQPLGPKPRTRTTAVETP